MDIIFIGIQGSGKGTQAKILAQKHNYEIFETGGELRKIAQSQTPLGQKIKNIIESGNLVSNEIVMEMVEAFIKERSSDQKIIFDGIPRSEEQRISLELLLQKKNRNFQAIEIQLSEEEVMKRLLNRAEKEGRSDDTPETIKTRINNFNIHTKPLLQAWKKQNKLYTVNGDQSIESVNKDIEKFLNSNA